MAEEPHAAKRKNTSEAGPEAGGPKADESRCGQHTWPTKLLQYPQDEIAHGIERVRDRREAVPEQPERLTVKDDPLCLCHLEILVLLMLSIRMIL